MGVCKGIYFDEENIREVTLKRTWKGVEVTDAKPQKTVIALPSYLLTFRKFQFPFTDKRKIQQALVGELMESLLLPIDKILWDILSIHQNTAYVLAASKEDVKNFLEKKPYKTAILDSEASSIFRLCRHFKTEEGCVIVFGKKSTSFYTLKEGHIEGMKVRMRGFRNLAMEVSQEEGITLEFAQEKLQAEGLDIPQVKKTLKNLLRSVFLDKKIEFSRLFITGEGANINGLNLFLEDFTGVKPEYFPLHHPLSPYTDAIPFGSALYEHSPWAKINFQEKKEDKKRKVPSIILWILIPFILYSINLEMTKLNLASKNKEIASYMKKLVKTEIPSIGKVVSPLMQVRALVQQSSQTKDEGMNALDIMYNLAKAKKGLKVDLYEIDIADSIIKVKGESDTFETVDNFKKSLKKLFPKVEIVEQKTKLEGSVDFFIQVETANETTK